MALTLTTIGSASSGGETSVVEIAQALKAAAQR